MEDGLNVVLERGGIYLGDEDRDIQVRYRFAADVPSAWEWWRLLQNNELAYIRMEQVSGFTAAARSSRTVLVEAVDPSDGERRRSRFSLVGLSQALGHLSCV